MVMSFCGRRILLSRSSFRKIPKRNGYIVLVPEIGEDLPKKDPLLKEDKTPDFNTITIEKCIAAIGRQTVEFEECITRLGQKLEKNESTDLFKDVLHPVEEMYLALQITWGIAQTLYFGNQSVMPTKSYMNMHDRAKRASASKYVNKPIYQACKNLLNNKDVVLSDQQKRVLSRFVLEGKLNGLDLTDKNLARFIYYSNMEQQKSEEFKGKLEVSTKLYTEKIQNVEVVRDFPKDLLTAIAADPEQPDIGPWTVTLDPNVLNPFLEYCPDRNLRWKVWEANVTRSSLYHDRQIQTSTPLEELRDYRLEKVKLLGFKTFAEMSMQTKMAESLDNVYCTMDTLLETAYHAQKREIEDLNKFATERGLQGPLKLWDIPYWKREHLISTHNYDPHSLKEYFPLPHVLSGLLCFIESLFDVRIVENNNNKPDTWHKDVRYFDIFDLKQSSTEPVGNFYLDLYARRNEKQGIYKDVGTVVKIKSRSKIGGMKPLLALIFDFAPPTKDRPSLLSFQEVKGLFRKFGYMLQDSLTSLDYAEIAGHAFLEWEAEFIVDHFMAHWLYEPSVLKKISSHHETGKPLPLDLINKLRYERSHLAGFTLCKELYLSRCDLELHNTELYWVSIMNKIWDKHFVIPQHKKDSHICSFDIIFSGGWGAAYYSFIWSQMIAADVYGAFQEISSGDEQQRKEVKERFRDTFLSLSGCYPTSEIFRRFRGRDPSPKALLNNLDLCQNTVEQSTKVLVE